MSPGRLLLAATPLGLPADASARLISGLGSADVVAAEDTRRVRTLAQALEVRIAGKVISLFDQNEATRVPALVEEIKGGATVLVVSDAGMPVINDPGYRLVSACVEAGLQVSCLPGPSAVTTALAVSGLPADRFCFEGFPPRKQSARKTWLAGLAAEQRTACSSSLRAGWPACLQDAVEVLGPHRRAVVCRELTKTHEEMVRGTLAELADWAAEGVLGEITVVLAGAEPRVDLETLVAEVTRARRRRSAGQGRVRAGRRRQSGVSVAARALRCGSAFARLRGAGGPLEHRDVRGFDRRCRLGCAGTGFDSGHRVASPSRTRRCRPAGDRARGRDDRAPTGEGLLPRSDGPGLSGGQEHRFDRADEAHGWFSGRLPAS